MRRINLLVLFLALCLCTEEITGLWRRTTSCGLKCGMGCSASTGPSCDFVCLDDCDANQVDVKLIPLPVDYDVYLCDDDEEINMACCLALLNRPVNEYLQIAFDAADKDGNGKISRTEFAAAPWFFEGEEDGASEDLRNAARDLREGQINGGSEEDGNGETR